MYRYSNQSRFNSVMRSNRYRPILVILIIIVAAFLLLKLVGVGGLNEANFESQRNANLRAEIQHATSQTNTLSRLGATTTSNVLGKIRQYVHGIEIINDLNVGMFGEVGRLYQQSVFDNIYNIIDAYDAKLSSGQKVSDSLTSLTAAVENLSSLTNALIGASAS
ncbi:MAG TPA: hypothetical protein PLP25_08035 [Candidatus Limiplasma sp.]|nr:hypothetical protein [Candidatus Limiplasma sp.]HPS81791.1 hypothetical protein [Candidatus Limiplasma sp.]